MSGSNPAESGPVLDARGARVLHTMIRVFDLDRSIEFYGRMLGMHVILRREVELGGRSLAFVGYGDEAKDAVIELIHDKRQQEPYTHGSGYGHVAIAVSDVRGACQSLERAGVTIARAPMQPPNARFTIAFIKDPDGYEIELIERS